MDRMNSLHEMIVKAFQEAEEETRYISPRSSEDEMSSEGKSSEEKEEMNDGLSSRYEV
jgi:hypothetical protein